MNRKQNAKNRKETEYSKKERIADSLKLPKDFILGASIVTMLGKSEVWIENYRGIVEYSTSSILLQAKTCQILVQGERLNIAYYTNEDMKITGSIHSVSYL